MQSISVQDGVLSPLEANNPRSGVPTSCSPNTTILNSPGLMYRNGLPTALRADGEISPIDQRQDHHVPSLGTRCETNCVTKIDNPKHTARYRRSRGPLRSGCLKTAANTSCAQGRADDRNLLQETAVRDICSHHGRDAKQRTWAAKNGLESAQVSALHARGRNLDADNLCGESTR